MRVFVCPNSRIIGELLNEGRNRSLSRLAVTEGFSCNFLPSSALKPKPRVGTHFAFNKLRRGVPETGVGR